MTIKDQLNLLIGLCTFILVFLLWPEKQRTSQKDSSTKNRQHHSWDYEPRYFKFFRKFKHWYPDENHHETKEREYWTRQNGIALLTLIGAVAAVVIAILAFNETKKQVAEAKKQTIQAMRQAKAAEDQVGVQTDTENRQLRAYVFLSEGHLDNFGIASPMNVSVKIKNSGQTPAYKLIARTIITFNDYPAKALPNPQAGRPSMDLGPTNEFTLRTTAARPLTSEEHSKVIGRTSAIYVYGEFSYIDAFSRCWLQYFKTYFGGNNGVTSDGALHPYNEGNYETECDPNTREPLSK